MPGLSTSDPKQRLGDRGLGSFRWIDGAHLQAGSNCCDGKTEPITSDAKVASRRCAQDRQVGLAIDTADEAYKAWLLILDDWGVAPITDHGRQDLSAVSDDSVPGASVLITRSSL